MVIREKSLGKDGGTKNNGQRKKNGEKNKKWVARQKQLVKKGFGGLEGLPGESLKKQVRTGTFGGWGREKGGGGRGTVGGRVGRT